MLKTLHNTARFDVDLTPRGPIAIRSGRAPIDPTVPDLAVARTNHAAVGPTVYLPGSSLKGTLRAQAERILGAAGRPVCDPIDGIHSHCFKRAQQIASQRKVRLTPPLIFEHQCDACRTFGSLRVAGRIAISDALPWSLDAERTGDADAMRAGAADANRTERRTQVTIDRKTGAARPAAQFDLEVVTRGTFAAEVHLRNFELWQLGLVAVALADLDDGTARIGGGKSRGFGFVDATIRRLRIEMSPAAERLSGVAALCTKRARTEFTLVRDDDTVALPDGVAIERTWRGSRLALEGDAIDAVLGPVVETRLAARLGALAAAADSSAAEQEPDAPATEA